MTKAERYSNLIAKFKAHKFQDDSLINPHSIDGFKYDVINPWELWHNNLNAKIMFIGQDFSDTASLCSNLKSNWQKEMGLSTNLTIAEFFTVLGVKYSFDSVDYSTKEKQLPLFFTNAILGIKKSPVDANNNEKESMSKAVKDSWIAESSDYLKELIDIVEPKYIIAMGRIAYKSVCRIYRIKAQAKVGDAIGQEIFLNDGKRLFVVGHCSGLGLRTRSMNHQINDWMDIRNVINPA